MCVRSGQVGRERRSVCLLDSSGSCQASDAASDPCVRTDARGERGGVGVPERVDGVFLVRPRRMQVTPDTFLQQLSFLKVGKATEVGVGVALGRSKSFGVRQAPPDVKRYNVATPATRRFL